MANLKLLSESVVEGDVEQVKELTGQAIAEGVDTASILNDGLISGMEVIGELFSQNEVFVPELLLAARAMTAGLELLEPLLLGSGVEPSGKVALGTIKGDVHNIGKDLVGVMLKGAGFEIIDLGVDVPPEKFADVVRDEGGEILGISGLLTTSLPNMETAIGMLESAGLRQKVKVMIGGAVVTKDYADRIGADGYAPNAAEALQDAQKISNIKPSVTIKATDK